MNARKPRDVAHSFQTLPVANRALEAPASAARLRQRFPLRERTDGHEGVEARLPGEPGVADRLVRGIAAGGVGQQKVPGGTEVVQDALGVRPVQVHPADRDGHDFRSRRLDGPDHRVVVAVAIDDPNYLADLKTAFGDGEIAVCRLTARGDTMAARLRIREPGMRQDEFVERSRQLDAALDQLGLEDFSLPNDDRGVTAVAAELLRRAGWM